MEDFEAPSFSLGFDETQEFNASAQGIRSVLHAESSPPRDSIRCEFQGNLNALATAQCESPNVARVEVDSDFDSPPLNSSRILKRLKHGPPSARGDSTTKQAENPAENSGVSKIDPLQSFWKSLKNKKTNTLDGNLKTARGGDEDDIEDFSSEDDFQPQEFCSQSSRKLSLCRNAAAGGRFAFQHASMGSVQQGAIQKDSSPRYIGSLKGSRGPILEKVEQYRGSDRFGKVEEQFEGSCLSGRALSDKSDNFFRRMDNTFSFSNSCNNSLNIPEVGSHGFGMKQSPDPSSSCTRLNTPWVGSHGFGTKQLPNPPTLHAHHFDEWNNSACSDYKMFVTADARVNSLLRQRLPHFIPVGTLTRAEEQSAERVHIDYINQFANCKNASDTTIFKKQAGRTATKRTATKRMQAAPKKWKKATAQNDGWVQPGSRSSVSTQKVTTEGEPGSGHWVTEKTGKRIYITRDGRKLSGSSAYKQHIKESGKVFKKTKRRRAQKK